MIVLIFIKFSLETELNNVVFVVQSLSHVWLLATLWTTALQTSLSFISPGVCSDSCPLSPWCYLTISSSASLFSLCPQSFLAPGSFPMSRLFASGGQTMGTSASASVLTMNIQGWFPCCLRDSQVSSSAPHFESINTSWWIEREKVAEAVTDFLFLCSKITTMIAAMKLKDTPWKESYDKPREHI